MAPKMIIMLYIYCKQPHFALVICNHGPPGPIAVEMSGTLTKVATALRGKYPGFALYMQKRGMNKKQGAWENNSGFTNEQSLQGGAFSGALLDQKSKSPLFPGPGGPYLQLVHYYNTVSLIEQSISMDPKDSIVMRLTCCMTASFNHI